MNLKSAESITQHVLARIGKFCELISPAGQVRRQCKEVTEIDFVLAPKRTIVNPVNLFESNQPYNELSKNFTTAIKELGRITEGKPASTHMQSIIWNAKVNFYMTSVHDFYRMLCIRTGSNSFVRNRIPDAWRRLGWCGTADGLRRIEDCRVFVETSGKRRFEVIKDSGARPAAWQSEEEFFAWLQLPYVEPCDR